MKPSQVSAELRRLAAYVSGAGRPSLRLVRLGAGLILRAMEEAPPTLRSPQFPKPDVGDVNWDWYLAAFENVEELLEEAKESGPDTTGYMAHSLRGLADQLRKLADQIEQPRAASRRARAAMELVHFGIGHPEDMDPAAALEAAKGLLEEAGYGTGDVDWYDVTGPASLAANIEVDPSFAKDLEEKGVLEFKGDGVTVTAEWSF